MGATKTDFYTDSQNELAILTKALGHPARVAIIDWQRIPGPGQASLRRVRW